MVDIISLNLSLSVLSVHRENNVSHAYKKNENCLSLEYITGQCKVEIYILNQQSQDALTESKL